MHNQNALLIHFDHIFKYQIIGYIPRNFISYTQTLQQGQTCFNQIRHFPFNVTLIVGN